MKQLLLILVTVIVSWNASAEVQVDEQTATALNTVTLFPDSTFFGHSETTYETGTNFTITERTELEHPDADQNQKFKWFKVKTLDGKEGWIFGDGLAVFVPKADLSGKIKAYHERSLNLTTGFENAKMWVAGMQGRDNLHAQDYMNPVYNEYYLVISNEKGKSMHINIFGESAMGESQLKDLIITDINGDDIPDFIVQKSIVNAGSSVEDRTVEIHSLQAGTMAKVFDERMTLTFGEGESSPALYKFVEVGNLSVRLSMVEYVTCDSYQLPYETDVQSQTKERCLQYVTRTHFWNDQLKKYEVLYEDTKQAIHGGLKKSSTYLLKSPDETQQSTIRVTQNDKLTIIKQYEDYKKIAGKTQMVQYFYVKTAKGEYGYLPAKSIGIVEIEYAGLLNNYYENPPIARSDWTSKKRFLKIRSFY